MRYLILFIAAAGFLLALLFSPSIQQRLDDSNAYQAQLHQLDLSARLSAQLDAQRQQEATAASRAAASNLGYLGAGAGVVIVLMFAVDFYRQRRAPLARFGGELVARDLIAQSDPALISLLADKIHATGVAQIEQARRPNVPHVYSPHWSNRSTALDLPEITTLPAQLAGAAVPSFAALLDSGKVGPDVDGRNQPLILGFSDDGAIEGSWRDLYSSAAGGLQGSGKTWGTAFLLAQSAAAGAKLVVCDPQAGDVESLANRVAPLRSAMLCDIADDDRTIGQALDLAYDILDRRDKGDTDRRPVIVAIDEWLSLRRGKLADRLPELIEAFSTRGRKMNVHCLLMTQRADKAAIGDFRNTLASSYIYRMRPDEARMLTGLRAAQLPEDVLSLPPGACYLLDTRGQLRRVQIPHCSPADIERVGVMLGGSPKGENRVSDDRPFGFQMKAKSTSTETHLKPGFESRETRPESAAGLAPEVARIISLFAQGLSIGEIVKAIHGEISGPKYNQARAEVERAIRVALARAA